MRPMVEWRNLTDPFGVKSLQWTDFRREGHEGYA